MKGEDPAGTGTEKHVLPYRGSQRWRRGRPRVWPMHQAGRRTGRVHRRTEHGESTIQREAGGTERRRETQAPSLLGKRGEAAVGLGPSPPAHGGLILGPQAP